MLLLVLVAALKRNFTIALVGGIEWQVWARPVLLLQRSGCVYR